MGILGKIWRRWLPARTPAPIHPSYAGPSPWNDGQISDDEAEFTELDQAKLRLERAEVLLASAAQNFVEVVVWALKEGRPGPKRCECQMFFRNPLAPEFCRTCARPAPLMMFKRIQDPEAKARWLDAMGQLQLNKAGQDFAAAVISALEHG